MADFVTTIKQGVTRCAKMITRNTKKLTKAAKFKTHEMSDLRKRRKLISNLGEVIYKLSNEGLVLPVDAAELVKEITLLDSDLNVLRSDRAAQKAADAQLRAAEKAALAAEKAAAKTAAVIEMSTAPVPVEIPDADIPETAPVTEQTEAPVLDLPVEADSATESEVPTLNV